MKNTVLVNPLATLDEYLSRADWRVSANANQGYSLGGMILNAAGKLTANYWLDGIYPPEVAQAHREADFHLHDLDVLAGYCAGWSLRQLLHEGFNGVPGRVESAPPRHLGSALGQMVNFLGTLQNEWAGAQAFSSVDTYLAPFIKRDGLTMPRGAGAAGVCLQPERPFALGHADAVYQPDLRLDLPGRPGRTDSADCR
jgi:ribonucleoside-triphosphate reductase